MDRDKIFVEIMKGLMSNPNLINNQYTLNTPNRRKQLIDMGKLMTNLIMSEITDEDDEDDEL